jgi:hypothetical protein
MALELRFVSNRKPASAGEMLFDNFIV